MSEEVMKTEQTGRERLQQPYYVARVVAMVYTLAVLCIFPFVVHDKYFDILPTKYRFYAGIVIMSAVILLLVFLITGNLVSLFRDIRDGIKGGKLWPTDWCVLAFTVLIIISTLQSDYLYESFWGNEGRYTGLFLLLLYVFAYFLVSRFLVFKQWYLDAFLGGGILACLWGITDYFRMDIFHFKERIASSPESFTSSFGNINTYTIYVAMVIAVASVLFALEKSVLRSAYYYVCFVIAMFAIIMGESDNAYLSLGALFALLPLYVFKRWQGIRRYAVLIATILTIAKCIDWINLKFADQVIGIRSLFSLVSGYDKIIVMAGGAWCLAGALYLLKLAVKEEGGISSKILMGIRIAWAVMLALAVAAVLYLFYDANFGGHPEKYASMAKYLVFNDSWGTSRGFAWRISWENFQQFPLHHKIFGYGPDTFGIITVFNNGKEMTENYHVVFDNAHNEYLQFLLTIGAAGLTAYLAFLLSAFVRMSRNAGGNQLVLAPMFAFVCYSVQAFVNLNVPITAPFMWLFLSIGVGMSRRRKTP